MPFRARITATAVLMLVLRVGIGALHPPITLSPTAPHPPDQNQAELESAGGADALIAAFQGLGDPLPLEDGSDCFAAQLPRVLVRILRALLPLVSAHPPQNQPPLATMEIQVGVGGGDGDPAAVAAAAAAALAVAAAGAAEAALGESLYGLAASTMEMLATLAAHGAAAELKAVGLDGAAGYKEAGGRGQEGGGAGGSRWVKEIAVGVGGSDVGGGGGGWGSGGGGGGGGGGRSVEVLEACWMVSRDIDGVRGE